MTHKVIIILEVIIFHKDILIHKFTTNHKAIITPKVVVHIVLIIRKAKLRFKLSYLVITLFFNFIYFYFEILLLSILLYHVGERFII